MYVRLNLDMDESMRWTQIDLAKGKSNSTKPEVDLTWLDPTWV